MIQLPTVLGLTLCEHIEVDRETGRFSLIGLFESRHFSQYPTLPVPFTAYTALFDGGGEGTLELAVNQLAAEMTIYRYRRWMAFPGRMLTVHMEIKVRQCIFPAPGEYDALLRFDGEELCRRRLDVYQN